MTDVWNGPVAVEAPAKVNLFLKILGKRPDGYHNLQSLMCPLGLSDRITLSPLSDGIRVRVKGGGGLVPETPENLVGKAATAFFSRVGHAGGVDIHLEKRIPVAAGLGGGSSDAASVLLLLNRLFGSPLSAETLKELALPLGADVPFFIHGGACLAEGVGEVLASARKIDPMGVVLVNPGFPVSTPMVYKKLNWPLTKRGIKIKRTHLERGGSNPVLFLENDLEPVTASIHLEVPQIKAALAKCGADGVLMSGSGPTVFGLFDRSVRLENVVDRLEGMNPDWRVIATCLKP